MSKQQLVSEVRNRISTFGTTPIPAPPTFSNEVFELGKVLAFDKILGGNEDTSCLTCHFPDLGSDDNRALSAGTGFPGHPATGLGLDRVNGAQVPRNAPGLFALQTFDALFWDSRVRKNANGDYVSPTDVVLPQRMRDVFDGPSGSGVVGAQAMFPVTSRVEMRGQPEQSALGNVPDNELTAGLTWFNLMARLGSFPEYVAMFEAAYPGTDWEDMNYAHVGNAIGAWEMAAFDFRNSPWEQFLRGDDSALSKKELRGAILFYDKGCADCHNGPNFTNNDFHNIGLPQFGPGKGDGFLGTDDFGREKVTGDPADRYKFRTPGLSNVELTGPYGHAGQYRDLEEIIRHYHDPVASLNNYDITKHVSPKESHLYGTVQLNQSAIAANIDPLVLAIDLDIPNGGVDKAVNELTAFLKAMTDDAARDLAHLVPNTVPSGLPVDDRGQDLGSVGYVDQTAALGISYERTPSARKAIFDQLKAQPNYSMATDVPFTPLKARGVPGVAIFDYDNDGDQDVYVTNGPGSANSLFSNQLMESGQLGFIDVAVAAGAGSAAQDSSGVCVGDIDNDGDTDMLVLGDAEPNVMFLNNGNGTFTDITAAGDLGGGYLGHNTCSMGDINGDGLLDIAVDNGFNMVNQLPIFVEPYALNHANQIYENQGNGVFTDVTASSGILNTTGFTPPADGSPTLTWALALVDVDADGDLDIVQADDQAAIPLAVEGGVDRGLVHIFQNDGSGHFTDTTVSAGTDKHGQWMGLSFGDLNCDGNIDFFGSNLGDYMFAVIKPTYALGESGSRWFLGNGDGSFSDPGVGRLVALPFGWGTGIVDYDNDGDHDIIFHGGMDVGPFVEASNPGAILENRGCGQNFFNATRAAGSTTSHARRNVQGVATGDLNNDGFPDTVSASNFNTGQPTPILPWLALEGIFAMGPDMVMDPSILPFMISYGSSFDGGGGMVATFSPDFSTTVANPAFIYNTDVMMTNGDLSVEINSGDNGNGWITVDTIGTKGLTPAGANNRGGIGAVITVTPKDGNTLSKPVTAGSSYASTHSEVLGFGLGDAKHATVDVLWPGGVRNRLYKVKTGSRVNFVEIPCSIDDQQMTKKQYKKCVTDALDDLKYGGLISYAERNRLRQSALRAWKDEH